CRGRQYINHFHAVNRFMNSWHDICSFLFWGPNSLRSDRWTPGRIKNHSYHAHEFYKTIKKRGNDLYTACPCKDFGDAGPSKWEVLVFYIFEKKFTFLFELNNIISIFD
ncbi:hypothetical protein, partial [Butyrivibrio fibrisolvens]|uniref:hypothetical protein n=1 Tax=Butyrivibrio fibrisolvens TaxID=831 RepID=UPI000551C99E